MTDVPGSPTDAVPAGEPDGAAAGWALPEAAPLQPLQPPAVPTAQSDGAVSSATALESAVPTWGAGFYPPNPPQQPGFAPVWGPANPSAARGSRNALFAGLAVLCVAGLVLVLVLLGHRGTNPPSAFSATATATTTAAATTVAVPAVTVTAIATVTLSEPVPGSDPGCSPAEGAITTATENFGHDIADSSASAADAQQAIDQAESASSMAKAPALKSAIDTMITHLQALHTAAESGDYSAEASALTSMETDIDAVYAACAP